MRRALLIVTAAVSLLAPSGGLAMKTQTLEFAEGRINASWVGQGDLTMLKTKDGLQLESGQGTGTLLTTVSAEAQPHFGVITASSPEPSLFFFEWSSESDPIHTIFTLPFSLLTGQTETNDFSFGGKWRPGEQRIHIVLPPNTKIILTSIELTEMNIFERSLEAVRSFWIFDEERPYSINFVWGPQIGWNPAERHHLYDQLPPVYLSGTLVATTVLILLLALIVATAAPRHTPRHIVLRKIGILFLLAWILFDARMGSEFLSWVWHDHTTYIAAEPGQREFRDRDAFYDFADFAAPLVQDRKSYVFFAERPWPYLGNMRYLTYPSIPGIDYMNDDTWVIYRRSDMGVDAAGHMTIDGEAISPVGTVLGLFDIDSFVFRVSK